MKTIEEQAKEFSKFDSATDVGTDLGSYRQGLFEGFLAGYQAAVQASVNTDTNSIDTNTKMNSPEKPDSCEHILDMDKMVDVNSLNNSNGWISVKDRLPELEKTSCSMRRESTCVLIVSYGNVYVAHLCEQWGNRSHFIFEACDCNCRGHDMESDEWTLEQVTHWMPLPEQPKEEE